MMKFVLIEYQSGVFKIDSKNTGDSLSRFWIHFKSNIRKVNWKIDKQIGENI